jgi:hypothetical protein
VPFTPPSTPLFFSLFPPLYLPFFPKTQKKEKVSPNRLRLQHTSPPNDSPGKYARQVCLPFVRNRSTFCRLQHGCVLAFDVLLQHDAMYCSLMVSSTLKMEAVCSFEKKQLHGLSPRANYTDRATAACRRNDCQRFADRRCLVVSVTDPYGHILGSRQEPLLFLSSSSSVVLTRLSGPRSRPTTFFL